MPLHVRPDPERHTAAIVAEGVLTGREIARALRALGGPDVPEGCVHALWDLRQVSGLDVTPDDFAEIVAAQRQLEARTGACRAALVTSDASAEDLTALLRMRRRASLRELRLFTSLAEAHAWIAEGDSGAGGHRRTA